MTQRWLVGLVFGWLAAYGIPAAAQQHESIIHSDAEILKNQDACLNKAFPNPAKTTVRVPSKDGIMKTLPIQRYEIASQSDSRNFNQKLQNASDCFLINIQQIQDRVRKDHALRTAFEISALQEALNNHQEVRVFIEKSQSVESTNHTMIIVEPENKVLPVSKATEINGFQDIEKIEKAIVGIYKKDEGFLGTGFFLDGNKLVTAYHVLESHFGEDEKIKKDANLCFSNSNTINTENDCIPLEGNDDAHIDKDRDIIIITFSSEILGDINPLKSYKGNIQKSQPVLVIGYPSLESYKKEPDDQKRDDKGIEVWQLENDCGAKVYCKALQPGLMMNCKTDSGIHGIANSIFDGNSGSPVLNKQGEVLGVVTGSKTAGTFCNLASPLPSLILSQLHPTQQ